MICTLGHKLYAILSNRGGKYPRTKTNEKPANSVIRALKKAFLFFNTVIAQVRSERQISRESLEDVQVKLYYITV